MLERFLTTRESTKAFVLARDFVENRPSAPRLLLLFGPPGCGKTHLLRSIVDVSARRNASTAYVPTREFLDARLAAMNGDSAQDRTVGADVLAIDDLQMLSDRPASQREIGEELRLRLRAGVRIACAAGCSLDQVAILADRIRRLPGHEIVELRRPGLRSMTRLVSKLATRDHPRLGSRAIQTIAAASEGDVGRALGALKRRRFERQLLASREQ